MIEKGKRFSSPRALLSAGPERRLWLEHAFHYYTDVVPKTGDEALRVLLVEPFWTDLASIPWYVQWWLDKYGRYNLASILHDYMLQYPDEFVGLTRKMMDQIFKEALIDQGVPESECTWMYRGVRLNSIVKGWFK